MRQERFLSFDLSDLELSPVDLKITSQFTHMRSILCIKYEFYNGVLILSERKFSDRQTDKQKNMAKNTYLHW